METAWECKAREDKLLNEALVLIKKHITDEEININRDLHNAVQKIVTVARNHGLLLN